ncbi:unnamed protein product [Arabidopsis arenosa]|uniref:SWIM-type domain-containing protein n=1 Tax=Arabidopsis arenosa TaxID=38785 RepID=A0A8S1ZS06_ARAAE|nr:unnamed protein product [Arabidopsis arenosa]
MLMDPDLMMWSIFDDFPKENGVSGVVEAVLYKLAHEDFDSVRAISEDKDIGIRQLCSEALIGGEVDIYIQQAVSEPAPFPLSQPGEEDVVGEHEESNVEVEGDKTGEEDRAQANGVDPVEECMGDDPRLFRDKARRRPTLSWTDIKDEIMMRPVIGLDGAFLIWKLKGEILAAVGIVLDTLCYFWAIAYSATKGDYSFNMDALRSYDQEGHEDLLKTDPRTWCRAFFSCQSSCENVCNNLSESFNRTIKDARKLPVINMLEEIKRSCMKRISKLCDKTKKCKTRYEVLEGSGSYSVNLLTRECACCRQWNLTGIPCPHAIFVIREKNRDPEDYVDRHLATHVWKATYKDNIEPDDDDPWSIHNAPKRWRNAQSQSTPLVAQSQSIPACSQNQFTQNSQHSSAPTANPSGRGRAHGRPSGVKNGQGKSKDKGKGKGRGKGSDEAPRPPVFFMSPWTDKDDIYVG